MNAKTIAERLLELSLDMDYLDTGDNIETELETIESELETIKENGLVLYNLLETIAETQGEKIPLIDSIRRANN